MASSLQIALSGSLRQIQPIQATAIAWMRVEARISLWAARRARIPALLGFGGDSAIELQSATFVLGRLRHQLSDKRAEQRAVLSAGLLLLVPALFVVVASAAATLLGSSESGSRYTGIVVLIAASLGVPWLAGQKRAVLRHG